MFFEIITQ